VRVLFLQLLISHYVPLNHRDCRTAKLFFSPSLRCAFLFFSSLFKVDWRSLSVVRSVFCLSVRMIPLFFLAKRLSSLRTENVAFPPPQPRPFSQIAYRSRAAWSSLFRSFPLFFSFSPGKRLNVAPPPRPARCFCVLMLIDREASARPTSTFHRTSSLMAALQKAPYQPFSLRLFSSSVSNSRAFFLP